MKFVEFVKFKAVMFHGTEVHVPEHIKYIAADKSGSVIGFEKEPVPDAEFEWWDNPTGDDMYDIGTVDLEGMNWTETLVIL
jgi:hypothetical protein